MKKASIQLSTNFIVVMVLTITVLGFGFALFGEIFSGATNLVDAQISDQCKNYLDTLLLDSDIAFCQSSLEVERGETVVAWLGIVNTYDTNEVCYRIDIDEDDISSDNVDGNLALENLQFLDKIIKTQQKDYMLLGIDSEGVNKGQYAISLKVLALTKESCAGDNPAFVEPNAETVRKLFVEVK